MLLLPQYRRYVIHTLTGVSLFWGGAMFGMAGTASVPITLTVTFVAGSCDILVNGGGTAKVVFPTSSVEEIVKAGKNGVDATDFSIGISNCSDVVGALPALKVSGTSITAGTGNPLFRAGASTSSGYGVRVIEKGSTANLTDGSSVSFPNFTRTDNLNTLNNHSKTFTASLSCGDCTTVSRKEGSLNAAVVFNFVYN